MTQVTRCADCGNSAKNQLLQELSIALACAVTPRLRELLTDDVRWRQSGRQPSVGVDAVCKASARYGPAVALTIEHVVSHGRAGAVDGVVEFGTQHRSFCHMFEFSNARGVQVKSISTWSTAVRPLSK